jgi:hypothetical protein
MVQEQPLMMMRLNSSARCIDSVLKECRITCFDGDTIAVSQLERGHIYSFSQKASSGAE